MDASKLAGTEWVHAFEEDTTAGAVYRPRGQKLPLARRARERLAFAGDGAATIFVQGPDDRYVENPATWHVDGDAIVVRERRGGVELKVVDVAPDRLVVQMRREA